MVAQERNIASVYDAALGFHGARNMGQTLERIFLQRRALIIRAQRARLRARTLDDLLFREELDSWRRTPDFQVRVTLDRAGREWPGDVGYVTGLLPKARVDPVETIAMICGPEVMIRSTAHALEDMGVAASRIFVSLERNMKCAVGLCGHCQLGPHFLCKDGPVYRYDRVRNLLAIREL
ncbi:MAG: hypothetical protein FJX45_11820 [Alphaproteobacteria bacterium]|nr:hypothetical protein [Alphaproteobacteria bacterium]MBM3655134.1 hypothetical protein [Alphaproteobacteria bacterium]